MITCTRVLKSDTGHRVFGHEGKCRHCHGHEYKYEITASAAGLDSIGRVIDFSVIKEKIGAWIDENWDHNFIVFKDDEELRKALNWVANGKSAFVAPFNPTAENMAHYLLTVVCPEQLKGTGVVVRRIKVWETSNCFAEAELSQAELMQMMNEDSKKK